MTEQSQMNAREIRKKILLTAYGSEARGCHFGGALSCVDFLSVLLDKYIINNTISPDSARIVLSKGHACLCLYALLNHTNNISDEELGKFETEGSYLAGHPIRNISHQIHFSTGSLGIGLANAVGQALYLRRKYGKASPKVIAIVGDGETCEGIVYESLCMASKLTLSNLIVFIDQNGLQQTGKTESISGSLRIDLLAEACGANAIVVNDGNDHSQLTDALSRVDNDKFNCIIGKTVKGKGISFMENNNDWHHNKLTAEDLNNAMNELKL